LKRNAFEKIYTVDASTGTVSLGTIVPIVGTMKVYNIDVDDNLGSEIVATASAPTNEQYSISSSTLTFSTSKKGARVLVTCDYMTGADATGVKIVSGKLPSLIRITARTKVEDKSGNKAVKTIIIEKCKPNPDFTFETSTNAASLNFECEVFGQTDENGQSVFFNLVTDPTLTV
jgi:hypothetical protein